LVLLSELSLRSLPTKLGALQRWVRECDAAFVSSGGDTVESEEGEMVMRVLDAILRVAGGGEKSGGMAVEGDASAVERVVKKLKEWVAIPTPVEGRVEIWKRNREGTLVCEFAFSHKINKSFQQPTSFCLKRPTIERASHRSFMWFLTRRDLIANLQTFTLR